MRIFFLCFSDFVPIFFFLLSLPILYLLSVIDREKENQKKKVHVDSLRKEFEKYEEQIGHLL